MPATARARLVAIREAVEPIVDWRRTTRRVRPRLAGFLNNLSLRSQRWPPVRAPLAAIREATDTIAD